MRPGLLVSRFPHFPIQNQTKSGQRASGGVDGQPGTAYGLRGEWSGSWCRVGKSGSAVCRRAGCHVLGVGGSSGGGAG